MTTDHAVELCEQVLDRAGGDADVVLSCGTHALLRIGESQPIQHGINERASLRLRLRLDGRYGEGSTDGYAPADLDRLCEQARQQAMMLPPAGEILPSVGEQTLLAVSAHHADSTPAAYDADRRAAAAEAMCAAARREGARAAGVVGVGERLVAMATSGGMRGAYRATEVDLSLTVESDGGSGWRSGWSRSGAALDPARLGEEACQTALRARDPRPLEPGSYRVVLSASAVATLLGFIARGFNARSVRDGRSFLAAEGDELFGPLVSITQNPAHPDLQDQPFDGDGWALRCVEFVRQGVAARLMHDRRTAAEMGAEATGWAGGGRLLNGAWPSSLVMAGGEASDDELLAACGDGIYVSRLHYTNWLNESDCSITGMTRDGTFRVRDGKLAEPLTNARIAQSLPDLLRGIIALGTAQRCHGCVAPALASSGLTFSSATSF